jgi:transcriptional regulator with PAS, ATPase and Fis domain
MSINATSAEEVRPSQFDENLSADFAGTAAEPATPFHGLVGSSASMRRLFRRIEAVAATRSTVLIVGESGTGKELVARAIPECGAQRGSFVPFNCATIPRDLVESELFGHRRGAFSSINADHPGLLRAAHGGTVFLDEITEMSPDLQAKLLRAIQERAVRPVGSIHEIPIDVRIVASTNRDLVEAVRTGQLRADLYYRMQVNVLEIPPLRDRSDDVAELAPYFLKVLNEHNEGLKSLEGIDPYAMSALQTHNWPGNVRELSNTIETAFHVRHLRNRRARRPAREHREHLASRASRDSLLNDHRVRACGHRERWQLRRIRTRGYYQSARTHWRKQGASGAHAENLP